MDELWELKVLLPNSEEITDKQECYEAFLKTEWNEEQFASLKQDLLERVN